jgi:hypothetical protein
LYVKSIDCLPRPRGGPCAVTITTSPESTTFFMAPRSVSTSFSP